jgi:hypothetical protein
MEGQEISMEDAIKASLNEAPAASVTETEVKEEVNQEEEKPQEADPSAPVATIEEDPAPAPVSDPAPAQTFDEAAWIKQHFGEDIDSIDTLKSKLNTPQPEAQYKEPTFENEATKKIYEALLTGKETEVAEYLAKKQFVHSLKEKTPEQVVKAGWKTEYGLTDAEADRKFDKQFAVDEYADEEDKVIEQKFIAKQIEKEAEHYKQYFSTYEQELKLPTIESAAPASATPQVDYTSEAAKSAIAFTEQLNKPVADLNSVGFEFSDSSLKLKGKVVLPQQEVSKIKTQLQGHEDKFIEHRWFKDGQFHNDQFARDAYIITHTEQTIQAAVAQAVHKARLEFLKENRNYQAGGTVVTGDFMPSEAEQKREWYRKNFM